MTDRSTGLAELRDRGGFTWTELDRGWMAVPDEVLTALAGDGFEECKHAMTTSRRDKRPAGGVWQGVNRTTGSVASAIWVAHAAAPRALVFVEIDGEPIQPNERERARSRMRPTGTTEANVERREPHPQLPELL